MLCCLTSILCSRLFIANIILGILVIEYSLYKCRPLIKIEETRDSKYSAFRRYDAKYLTRSRLYLAAPIVVIRFLLLISYATVAMIIARTININVRKGEQP